MKLPDTVLLSKIKEKHAYCDEKSLEVFTKKCSRKYKICAKRFIDITPLFISTSNPDAYPRAFTISINYYNGRKTSPIIFILFFLPTQLSNPPQK